MYTLDNFRAWTDRSRQNLGVDTLDLVQLHCPPTPVFCADAVYDALDTLVEEERIAAYGVSVENVRQALTAIARPGVASVQIILNMFRLKPLERVLPAAARPGSASSPGCRSPAACCPASTRADHVRRRRPPQLQPPRRVVRRRRDILRRGLSRPASMRRPGSPLSRPKVRPRPRSRCGGSSSSRASPPSSPARPRSRRRARIRPAADLAELSPATLDAIESIYDERIRAQVHDRW